MGEALLGGVKTLPRLDFGLGDGEALGLDTVEEVG